MIEHKTVQEAINAVMAEVGYVHKTKSSNLNYSYAGESALISAIRPSMVEHGVVMYVEEVTDIKRESYTTTKGTQMINTVIRGIVAFQSASNPESVIYSHAVGEGSDAGDKSANKAMTGMYKYALRQTFCIETGDDPDKYSSEEQERPAKSPEERPWTPEVLKQMVQAKASFIANKIGAGEMKGATEVDRKVLASALGTIFKSQTERYEFSKWIVGEASTKKMDAAGALSLMAWLKVKNFEDEPDPISRREAISAHATALIAAGQTQLPGVS